LDTAFILEETEYSSLNSRDVNNYAAVKIGGRTKGKGIFAESGISKNPDHRIVYEAVLNFLGNGVPVASTIYACNDMKKFVTVRNVTGGAMWRGQYLGKAVRFYKSLEGDVITYRKNGNRVPNSESTTPMMTLDHFPADLDRDWYVNKAVELLQEVGYHA
jgi:hypothetical protein